MVTVDPITVIKIAKEVGPVIKDVLEKRQRVNRAVDRLSAIHKSLEQNLDNERCADGSMKSLVRSLTYDIGDLIDYYRSKELMAKVPPQEQQLCCTQHCLWLSTCYLWLCTCCGKLYTAYQIADEIQELNNDLNMYEKLSQLNQKFFPETTSYRPTSSTPYMIPCKIYGRDADIRNVINLLVTHNETGREENVSVIGVAGAAGIGKTTVAQCIHKYFHDERSDCFQQIIWVGVSKKFDEKEVITLAIECATRGQETCQGSLIQVFQDKLHQLVGLKRFLLILDDVWSVTPRQWENIMEPLQRGHPKGSKVLVTSRNHQVFQVMRVENPYVLKGLSYADCWSIFADNAFPQNEGRSSELVKVGKEIVKQWCGCLPLTAKAVGDDLFSKKRPEDWSHWTAVHKNGLLDRQEILPKLKLSFDHLDPHLKPCFAYCSQYPRGCEINVGDLIQQWMAHGFVKGDRSLEDIGNDYFEKLKSASIFEQVTEDDFGNKTCKMHDPIYDMALSVAKDEYFVARGVGIDCRDTVADRHLTILPNELCAINDDGLTFLKKLRTLSVPDLISIPSIQLDQLFSVMKYLRVLILSRADDVPLPDTMSNLINLRYLKVDGISLPDSICNLPNLQTLKIGNRISQLPENLCRLIGLRHLEILAAAGMSEPALQSMPPGIGRLTRLQTLSSFVVSTKEGCGVDQLSGPDLKGSLAIHKLENVSDADDARKAQLHEKSHLKRVELHWSTNTPALADVGVVLDGLCPHKNLRGLSIYNYSGDGFSSWLMDSSLSSLVHLELHNCNQSTSLPTLSYFSALKVLKMSSMQAIAQLTSPTYKCPSLKKLSLLDMANLDSLHSDGIDHAFPNLDCLVVSSCPLLASLPVLPSLRHLTLTRCNARLLASINSLTSLSTLHIEAFGESAPEHLPRMMLHKHTFLEHLTIACCPNLHLWEPNFHPRTLKHLVIKGCPNLDSFSEWMQNLSVLEVLQLHQCQSLPTCLQNLTSVCSLILVEIETVAELPAAVLQLQNLVDLKIYRCPSLRERYNTINGIDRDNLLHIPHVTVEG